MTICGSAVVIPSSSSDAGSSNGITFPAVLIKPMVILEDIHHMSVPFLNDLNQKLKGNLL